MNKKTWSVLGCIWIAVMAAVLASALTLALTGGSLFSNRWVSSEEYEVISRYSRLEEIRQTLTDEYYVEVDDSALMDGAAKGMMAALEDPYTLYYTPEEMAEMEEEESDNYSGIGVIVQCNADERLEIISVFEDSPAEDVGLLAGDCIVCADGVAVSGKDESTMNDAVARIGGEIGTVVRLEILRGEETFTCDVRRGDIHASNISYEILEDGIGYVGILQFTGNVADDFDAALQTLRDEGAKGLIIDLRGNPGGLLDDVVAMCDKVLPAGLIVATEDRNGKRDEYYSSDEYWNVPLVVLIDEDSASASEIMAAAVQDFGRGRIVGTNSFGKGIVQTLITYSEDGAGMQYTSAQYFTPSGKCIHGVGVVPDVEIADNPDTETDECLQRAIEILNR